MNRRGFSRRGLALGIKVFADPAAAQQRFESMELPL